MRLIDGSGVKKVQSGEKDNNFQKLRWLGDAPKSVRNVSVGKRKAAEAPSEQGTYLCM